jgi:hypothetical protein
LPVKLVPFRYRDALTGRWIKARYKATREDIAARHAEWEITGPAEVWFPIGDAFNPYRIVDHAELQRLEELPPELNLHLEHPPAIDEDECSWAALFLRRYVAYCARRGRYAQMQGAARLHREIVMASCDLLESWERARPPWDHGRSTPGGLWFQCR